VIINENNFEKMMMSYIEEQIEERQNNQIQAKNIDMKVNLHLIELLDLILLNDKELSQKIRGKKNKPPMNSDMLEILGQKTVEMKIKMLKRTIQGS